MFVGQAAADRSKAGASFCRAMFGEVERTTERIPQSFKSYNQQRISVQGTEAELAELH